ncbi:MAG: 2,3-bisphosphoglycerate-independent phosphoglycerate mutase [Francisellaceae bacterium]|jgi:2,3-bisphosphoglycerate-independent phosphoglycerate mutase|nr:2,3-bisphosphoglycerate-independent phosphoglycerate mutase [Francisellaceae bacterium]MBT6207497.1 2,3-bisphosphoglycerate-independent phosphoglycerate mutase [Francisellaceae bacterium]MBT6538868.1 2,3-bisphosphoglycerate-independent phosphoglycerate mutase [Francisellaceae bacterium]
MNNKPVVLLILDGWGDSKQQENNAISMAKTPTWDKLLATTSHTLLNASGSSVGLPEGQMGNSEVGHMVIGSGRVTHQDLSRINLDMQENGFATNNCLTNAIDSSNNIHLLGLVSDGGVHSHEQHLHTLLELCKARNRKNVFVHAFLDGRDTPPKSAKNSIKKLLQLMGKLECGKISSISGRFFAMDRDKRFDRTKLVYNMLTQGISPYHSKDALSAVELAYARNETDEFIQPTSIDDFQEITSGDTVIFFNFRSDRARQLSRALTEVDFPDFPRAHTITLKEFVTFTNYADSINANIAFPKPELENIFAQVCAENNLSQLKIAETEKYAHVTFFFNGGIEAEFPNEERILIPSPKVDTYDLKPQMSAQAICQEIVDAINNSSHDVIVANFANADMVGHTGDLAATISAIEFLDACLTKILTATNHNGATLLITADHGNADCMYNAATQQAHTAHTNALVPLVLVSKNRLQLKNIPGTLADIAPTMLNLLNIEPPSQMTGTSLLK